MRFVVRHDSPERIKIQGTDERRVRAALNAAQAARAAEGRDPIRNPRIVNVGVSR